jgi:hypothetical protein
MRPPGLKKVTLMLSSYQQDAEEAFQQLLLVIFDNERVLDALPNKTQAFIKERSASTYNYTYEKNERVRLRSTPLFS